MSKLDKKKRKKTRPAAVAKESTRTVTNVPTKARKKLKTKKEIAAQKAKLKGYAKNVKAPPPVRLGSSGSLAMISPGKVLKGGKMVLNFIKKNLVKKGVPKVLDKKKKK